MTTATATDRFDSWLSKVDAILSIKTGLSLYDLEDQPYRDWFDDGVRPGTAARRAYRAAGGPL